MEHGLTGLYRSGMERVLQRFDPRVVDAVLAIAIAVFALIEVWPGFLPVQSVWYRMDWIGYLSPMLLALVSTLPLAFRRRYPVAVLLVIGASMAGWFLRGGESPGAVFLAFFVAIFSAAAYATNRRRSLFGYGVLAILFFGLWWSEGQLDAWLLFIFAFTTGIWLAGDTLRARTVEAREHERRVGEIERQRATALRQAAAEERARIARELHDVIAHNLSVIVIQAGAAQRVLDEQPDVAREALRQVEVTGRVAMTEMRRLLGVVRRGDDEPLTVPQPGVASLDTLLDDVRAAGLTVTLRTSGDDRPLPPGVDVSVYRIVQEALTNTLRHAQATQATVDIRYLPASVDIEVADDGRGATDARWDTDGGGHGLAGMRERAGLFDGAFEAGPQIEWWLRCPSHVADRARRSGGLRVSIRILLVDDQTLVRTGFRLILGSEPDFEVVGDAADGQEGIELGRRLRPDVALMDIRMPRMDGIEATRRLTTASPATKVVILTTYDLDEYVFDALRAGASGFILKDAPADQLVNAVRVAAAGDALLAPSITRRLVEEFARRAPRTDVPLGDLTPRELEVLKLMARALSNAEIANRLVVSEGTVKTHVARILMKLECRDRVQAVVAAYESGLVQPGIAD